MQGGTMDLTLRNHPPPSDAPTILLAEDDDTVRALVVSLLMNAGYSVLKASNSLEALTLSRQFAGTLSLLLTDVCMAPHFNGRKLAKLIRATRPEIPVLYMSGCVDDEELVREIGSGFAHFIPKPFSPSTLLESVRLAMIQAIAAR